MSQFSYEQYQNVVSQQTSTVGVGYFKLKDDGDIAVARINLSSTEDFNFAAVHTLNVNGKWMKVSCLNPLGTDGNCPLCAAQAANTSGSIGKTTMKLFIPMLVSYRDPTAATGYTAPAPVIWDRPAMFSKELANKLMIAGDLKNTLVLITRNGKAGDMHTTYSVDILPELHPVFKPDMVPADFSAFNNFNIAKHSYWEKTVDEINTFIATGQFPEDTSGTNGATSSAKAQAQAVQAQAAPVVSPVASPIAATPVPNYPSISTTPPAPVSPAPAPVAPTAPVPTPAAPVSSVPNSFSGFSF